MGFKAFIKAFLGFFWGFFAIYWGILMVFFVKFWGIKILFLVITITTISIKNIVVNKLCFKCFLFVWLFYKLGDATASVGDPSGRLEERPKMSALHVSQNTLGLETDVRIIADNYKKYFATEGKLDNSVRILKNNMWYKQWSVVNFVRDIGRLFRMGQMLSRTSVKSRLQSPQGKH